MAWFSTTVLFLSMFSSLGMGAQNGLDDHPDLPGLLANFRVAAADTLKKFKDGAEKSPEEEKAYQKAREHLRKERQTVEYCGIDFGKRPESGPIFTESECVLIKQREKLLAIIWAEEHAIWNEEP